MIRFRALAASASTTILLAAALAPGASAEPHAATARPAAAQSTTLLFTVIGCNGCKITAYNTRTQRFTYGTARVVSGKAAMVVPSSVTRYMSFDLKHPKGYGSSNAVAGIVIRYAGKKPGQRVSPSQAASAKKATWCWAGTTRQTQKIKIKVQTFPDTVYGEQTYSLRAWVVPTLPSRGAMMRTWKGGLGHQDAPYC